MLGGRSSVNWLILGRVMVDGGGWYFGHNACVLGLNFRAP